MIEYERSPTFGQVLDRLRESAKRQTHVAMPGQVQSYDVSTQTADVQPLIDDQLEQEDGSFKATKFPVCTHVPVAFPGAAGFRLTFPVRPGDTGLLIFCDLSTDAWQQQSGHQSPKEQRRHHMADAVFFPGLHADPQAFGSAGASSATLGPDGGPQLVMRSGTIEVGGSESVPPTDFMVKGTSLVTALATLDTAWGVYMTALTTYVNGIQGLADPSHTVTPAFLAAIVTMGAAITAFQTAATAAVSLVAKVE